MTEYLTVDAPELWERPPADVLNVRNGLLDLTTRTLAPHSPAHLSPIQLPVVYDPAATCPAWDQFIRDVFPEDALDVAYEIAGDLVTSDRSVQRSILLQGEGANGKRVYLRGLTRFVGRENVAGISLHKLESDRFAPARLVGKLANICPDLPSAHLEGTSTFKAITGGDRMVAEFKYRNSFEFEPFCRLVFSANHPPQSADASYAFFRRWLVVPFSRTFEGAAAVPQAELDARLAQPRELSGLLNKALDALRRLRRHGDFTESATMRRAWEEFREVTDPLAVWLDAHTVEAPDGVVRRQALIQAYNTAATQAGQPVLTQKSFGQAIRRLRPRVQPSQRVLTTGGKPEWCWIGITLQERPPTPVPTSHHSQDSYIVTHRATPQETEGRENRGSNSKCNPVNPVNTPEVGTDDDAYYTALAEAYEDLDPPAELPVTARLTAAPNDRMKPCPAGGCGKMIPLTWQGCAEHEADWRARLPAQQEAR